MLLLLSWTTVREVCLNHGVVVFQPRTGTSPDLGSVAYCYVAIILSNTLPFLSSNRCPLEGETHFRPFFLYTNDHPVTTQDHLPTRASPVSVPSYQDHHVPHCTGSSIHLSVARLHCHLPPPFTLLPLIQVPPPVLRPRHPLRIPISAPSPQPKSLLTYP